MVKPTPSLRQYALMSIILFDVSLAYSIKFHIVVAPVSPGFPIAYPISVILVDIPKYFGVFAVAPNVFFAFEKIKPKNNKITANIFTNFFTLISP